MIANIRTRISVQTEKNGYRQKLWILTEVSIWVYLVMPLPPRLFVWVFADIASQETGTLSFHFRAPAGTGFVLWCLCPQVERYVESIEGQLLLLLDPLKPGVEWALSVYLNDSKVVQWASLNTLVNKHHLLAFYCLLLLNGHSDTIMFMQTLPEAIVYTIFNIL